MDIESKLEEIPHVNVTLADHKRGIIQFEVENFTDEMSSTIRLGENGRPIELTLRAAEKPKEEITELETKERLSQLSNDINAPATCTLMVRHYQDNISPHINVCGSWGTMRRVINSLQETVQSWDDPEGFYH